MWVTQMKKEVTIKDIAQIAGVSIATVSKVINNQGRVGEDTRKRICKIIEENHYSPNHIAVSMIKKMSHMIVVMVPDIFTRFYAEIVQGAEERCKERDYSVLVYTTGANQNEEFGFFQNSFAKMADGILCIPSFNDPAPYRGYGKPLVMVDRYIDNCMIDGIVADNFGGASQLTNYLIDQGIRRIAFVSGSLTMNVGRDRLKGYVQAMSDAGLDSEGDVYICDWYERDGYKAVFEMYQSGREVPGGIVTGNGNIGNGVINAIQEINGSLSAGPRIVCFDDSELARFAKVTTLNRNNILMGNIAANMLLDKIESAQTRQMPQVITMPLDLIVR